MPDVVAGEEMAGDPGADRDRDGVPDLTLEVEEETEPLHPGGDVTGRDHGLTTETESETETGNGAGTGIGIGTGDDNQHEDERGKISGCLQGAYNSYYKVFTRAPSFLFLPGPDPAHGRGAALGEGGEAVGATDGETATVAVPLSPQNVQTTAPLLATEGPGSLSSASVTS